MKKFKSPFSHLVWFVLCLSGVVSLSVSPKAAEEGASVPLAASLSHLKPAAFLQGLNFLRHYWLRFLFCLTASIINFSGGEVLAALQTFSKGVTFVPGSTAWEAEAGSAVACVRTSALLLPQGRKVHEFTRQDHISIATYLYILCLLYCNARCLGYCQ